MRRVEVLWGLLLVAAIGCGAPELSESDVGALDGEQDVASVSQGVTTCADGPTVEGIDVSRFQGTIDWQKVAKAGKKFAYIQVARGLSPDDFFDFNWAEAKANGILRGAYLRFFPDQDLAKQAQLLIDKGPYRPGDLPPMLDIEDHGELDRVTLAAKVTELIQRVEKGTGRLPVIYTGYYFWRDRLATSRTQLENPLFIAHYDVRCPLVPAPWSRWLIHQYTSEGRLDAVTVNTVDLNRFNGSLQALKDWAGTKAPGPDVVVPGATGTLTGAIYERGRPAARVRDVRVAIAGQPEQRTGADGLYTFKLPPGTYTATVSKPGFHTVTVTRTVKAGAVVWGSTELTPDSEQLEPTHGTGTAISGFVLHAGTGEHLAGAAVSLRHENGELLASTVSDASGAFELKLAAAPPEGTLLAHAEGFAPVSLPVSLEAGVPLVMDVTLKPLDLAALGSLNDEDPFVRPEPVTGCNAAGGLSLFVLCLLIPLVRRRGRASL